MLYMQDCTKDGWCMVAVSDEAMEEEGVLESCDSNDKFKGAGGRVWTYRKDQSDRRTNEDDGAE